MKKRTKRLFAVIISIVLIIAMLSTSVFAVEQGDVNDDGKVTNNDLVMLSRYIIDYYTPGSAIAIEQYGDMNGDGRITNTDAILIARIIIGY